MSPYFPVYHEVVESADYSRHRSDVGDCHRVDEALCGVITALSSRPKEYDLVEGMKDVRLAKTVRYRDVPALAVWFRVVDTKEVVELLMIERLPDED